MRIAFALVAHEKPPLVERLIRNLVSEGHFVAVHYDLKAPLADYERLVRVFAECESVRFARRVRVAWAEWSIVEATLNCLDEIEGAGWNPDYVYLLSGADYPIRPSDELKAFLKRNKGYEFIQSVAANHVRWVKTGPQTERYRYRFHFNWREQPLRCRASLWLQKKLGLKRKFVRNLEPYIGSQWWVLTWDTLRQIMELARQPDIRAFFRTVLVPDELFFQTMVRQVAPDARILGRTLTLFQFTDYGFPVVYHADHADYLLRQPFFMARKLSPHQSELRDKLDACWHGEPLARPFDEDDVGMMSPEYEDWRVTYRDGAPGQPIVGRAPDRWSEDLARLTHPYFAVIGTSTAELGLLYQALSRHPDVLCHGQLFHPRRIEFAHGQPSFAGYGREDFRLRELSAPNFLADVIRAEKRRLSGFLLRAGQGWHIAEVILGRPSAKVVLLRGDILLAFAENVLGVEPRLDQRFKRDRLTAIPPAVLANRFRRFVKEFQLNSEWLAQQAAKAAGIKPKGWIAELDCTSRLEAGAAGELSRGRRAGNATEAAVTRVQGWTAQLEQCLGIEFADGAETHGGGDTVTELPRSPSEVALMRWHGRTPQAEGGLAVDMTELPDVVAWNELAAEFARLEERSRLVAERLVAGGISPIVFDLLRQHGMDGPRVVATLV